MFKKINIETLNDFDEKDHWNIISGGTNICFVCDGIFKKGQIKSFVGKHKYTGKYLYRHKFCDCSSANWNSKFGGRLLLKKKNTTNRNKN